MVGRLNHSQIQHLSQQVPAWTVEGYYLKLVKRFKKFIEAIEFVNKRVVPSEASGHHPDLEISYNKVTICLTTHDARGLTKKYFVLAQQKSALG